MNKWIYQVIERKMYEDVYYNRVVFYSLDYKKSEKFLKNKVKSLIDAGGKPVEITDDYSVIYCDKEIYCYEIEAKYGSND